MNIRELPLIYEEKSKPIVEKCSDSLRQTHILYDYIIVVWLQKGMEIREKSCKLRFPGDNGAVPCHDSAGIIFPGAMKKTVK
jgi:hypothetical protein